MKRKSSITAFRRTEASRIKIKCSILCEICGVFSQRTLNRVILIFT